MFAEGIRCVKNVTIHTGAILSINAGEHWLGIGAADNSMSLYHRPQERLGGFSSTGSKMAGWQLYRAPQKTVAVVIHHFSNQCSFPSLKIFHFIFYIGSNYIDCPVNIRPL